MAVTWTTPHEWVFEEPITVEKMNNELSNNMSYLFDRPKQLVTVRGDGTNLTTSAVAFAALDDAQFTVQINTRKGDVEVFLVANVSAASAVDIMWDVLIDDTNYLSSGTPTAVSSGLQRVRLGATQALLGIPVQVTGLTPGVHTFKLRVKCSAAVVVTFSLNAFFLQYGVREL